MISNDTIIQANKVYRKECNPRGLQRLFKKMPQKEIFYQLVLPGLLKEAYKDYRHTSMEYPAWYDKKILEPNYRITYGTIQADSSLGDLIMVYEIAEGDRGENQKLYTRLELIRTEYMGREEVQEISGEGLPDYMGDVQVEYDKDIIHCRMNFPILDNEGVNSKLLENSVKKLDWMENHMDQLLILGSENHDGMG